MKITIVLPADLLAQTDEQAQKLGISRQELLTMALQEFIMTRQQTDLTGQINAACHTLDTALPEEIARITRQRLLAVEW